MNIKKSFSFLLEHEFLCLSDNLENEHFSSSEADFVFKNQSGSVEEYLRIYIPFRDSPVRFIYRKMNKSTGKVLIFAMSTDVSLVDDNWCKELIERTVNKHESLFRIKRIVGGEINE